MVGEIMTEQNANYDTDGYQSGFQQLRSKSFMKENFVISPLNLKSSVLCPENRRLTSQYLALEQIHAHQKMVTRSKGYVDTSSPKSMSSYLSYIERKKKENKGSCRMPMSVMRKESKPKMHGIPGLQSIEKENQSDASPPTPVESLDKGIQANVLPDSISKVADKISWYLEAVGQGEFIAATVTNSFLDSGMNIYGSQSSFTNSFGEKANKGDIMDWHPNAFTQNKWPFSPRILIRNNARSKLLDMRCYNAPKKKMQKTAVTNEALDKYEHSSLMTPTKRNVDYNDWISDQAQRVLMRQKMKAKVTNQECLYSIAQDSYLATPAERHSHCQSPLQILTCDEESKYLNYLSEVTEDILRSGIYTDRAIKRAFEFHLQFHEKEADRVKLIQLLEQVLDDLQIDDCEDSFQRGLLTSIKSKSLCNSPPEKETLEHLIDPVTPEAGISNASNESAFENNDHFNLIPNELNSLQDVSFADGNDKERPKCSLPHTNSNQKHASVDNFVSSQ